MGEKIIVGPFNQGLRSDREPFVIDNDSFPKLINAYQWRGRVKRKRGTSLLNRVRRFFNSASTAYGSTTSFVLNGSGQGNLLTAFGLQSNGNIFPTSVSFLNSTSGNTYTDPAGDGVLVGAPGGAGTINYATGAIDIGVGAAGNTIDTVTFNYYPDLPVMGLRDLELDSSLYPKTIAFDTVYSYNVVISAPYSIYDVSFYKNPITGTYAGYTQKGTVTRTSWNGQDYQQFWTVNYQGAFWATNGMPEPFSATNIGMQFKRVTAVGGIVAGPPAFANLTIAGHGLVVGDFVFINEIPDAIALGINYQTGYVTVIIDPNNITVEFPNATLGAGAGATATGIAQYLTNRADATLDCLRWYDGDPTNGNATTPTLNGRKGWVNFAPPLNTTTSFSIADAPGSIYYLVGARMIMPYRDRLLFIGPVIENSAGSKIYLQDSIIYSQNGTAFYTASFDYRFGGAVTATTSTAAIANASMVYNPILVPDNQSATAPAYIEDIPGYGGFVQAGFQQPILTAATNEDTIILGFTNKQSRLVYTGNDLVPFNFYTISSELGSSSTFSTINMDDGSITIGQQGIIISNQVSTKRLDLSIPDQVFQIRLTGSGANRVCSARDYINEWIYFTYLANNETADFPNQTILYNYREGTWGIFNESYTTYGTFRKQTGLTWATIGQVYPTWQAWTVPWSAGSSTLLQPLVIAGNQQGFVMVRDQGTGEASSLYIQSFSGNNIISPDHGLNDGDFILISNCIGTISSQVNGKVFKVDYVDDDTIKLSPGLSAGTYLGLGTITRMYVPQIQTKQFPVAWGMARKTRIGPQQYLFTTTNDGQIIVQIFLSQNAASAYNRPPIVPTVGSVNNSLVYSNVLYTCPESTNLGLTAANINLQMVTAEEQQQTWHRMNTSLIGDTVQIGFTMSEDQMRDADLRYQFDEIELHGFILDVSPSMALS